MIDLTEEQIERYSRHILLQDVGLEGQKKLLNAKVLIIGAGGLGSPVALYLAAPPAGTVPTSSQAGVLGAIAGMLGTIQAAEALKYFLGVGDLLTDRLLTFDAKTMNFRTIKVKKRASCEICGDHPTQSSHRL